MSVFRAAISQSEMTDDALDELSMVNNYDNGKTTITIEISMTHLSIGITYSIAYHHIESLAGCKGKGVKRLVLTEVAFMVYSRLAVLLSD